MHGQRNRRGRSGLTGGIEFLFKKNKVEWLKGRPRFTGKDSVKVGDREVRAKNIVIATGFLRHAAAAASKSTQKVVVDSHRCARVAQGPRSIWSSSAAA